MLELVALVPFATAGLGLWYHQRRDRRRTRLAAAATAAPIVLVALLGGRDLAIQKLASYTIMPAGLLFLGLAALAIVLFARDQRGLGLFAAALLLFYSTFGNTWVATVLTNRLERDFPPIAVEDTPEVDALLVLGGGAVAPPEGGPKLSDYGDRVVHAARLYFAGKAKLLVTSGSSIPGMQTPQDLSEATRVIWTELRVPDEAILRLPEPKNTSQEIRAFKALAEERGFRRVGVLTSAWHLSRAMARCRDEGLDAVPVASDHRGGEASFHPALLIPQPGAFKTSQSAVWELVGMLAGR